MFTDRLIHSTAAHFTLDFLSICTVDFELFCIDNFVCFPFSTFLTMVVLCEQEIAEMFVTIGMCQEAVEAYLKVTKLQH